MKTKEHSMIIVCVVSALLVILSATNLFAQESKTTSTKQALFEAALTRDVAKYEEILGNGGSLKEKDNVVRKLVELHEIANLLMSANADINAAISEGMTALMIASKEGYFEIVDLLISKNANMNVKSNTGMSALLFASKNGHVDIIKSLINANADIKAVNYVGNTSLMYASQNGKHLYLIRNNGHRDIIKSLIDANADVNAANSEGLTALMFASKNGHRVIIKSLIDANADINAANFVGITSLMYASQNGKYLNANYLISKNASINKKTAKGKTALILAAESGQTSVIKLLTNNNAHVDIQDKNQKTALMYVSQKGNYQAVKTLLKAGTNRKLEDKNSHTAEDIAKENNHNDCVGVFKWDKKKFFFNFNINNSVLNTSGYSSGLGAGIGIGFSTKLTQRLILRNEAVFNIRTSNISREILNIVGQPYYELHSVDLIPSIKVVLGDIYEKQFYSLVGAGYQKLISVKILNDSDEAFEEDIITDVTSKSDGSYFTINAGLGYIGQTPGHRFPYFEVRYSYGLSTKIDNINTSVNSINFIVGFGF